jgi:hypothetical protein
MGHSQQLTERQDYDDRRTGVEDLEISQRCVTSVLNIMTVGGRHIGYIEFRSEERVRMVPDITDVAFLIVEGGRSSTRGKKCDPSLPLAVGNLIRI